MRKIVHYLLACIFIVISAIELDASEKGNVYHHPTGLTFWYPQSWRLQEMDGALQLVPKDVVTTQEGPSEFYFVSGESTAGSGISRADDPQVISYVDQQVRSVLPQLQLSKDRKHVKLMGTQGVVFSWAGNNNFGKLIEGRAYIVIVKDVALVLSAIAHKGLIDKRNASLTKVFTSFVFGEGQLDQALVGTWNKYATASLANPDRIYQTAWTAAQSVSEDKSHLTFSADGRWHRVNTSHALVGAGGIWLEDKSKKEYSGKWFADGKKLFVINEDNTWEDFAYKVVPLGEGRELRTSVGNKATIWRQ
jgi:hypothetical protein